MSLFSKIKNVFNSSSIDIPDAQTIYFKNGEMYKVYPTDKESWYDARYLVSDGVKYDLENLDDLRCIPIPAFTNIDIMHGIVLTSEMAIYCLLHLSKLQICMLLHLIKVLIHLRC